MLTNQDNFHAMKGHIIEGIQIQANNGDLLTLKAQMKGWVVEGPQGKSPEMTNAMEVESYIVRYGL